MNKNLDYFGIGISALCLVHCLVLPGFLMSLPILARYYFTHAYAHLALAFFICPIALIALWKGYRKHGKLAILALGITGVGLIVLAALTRVTMLALVPYETYITLLGSVLLILAHALNLLNLPKASCPT